MIIYVPLHQPIDFGHIQNYPAQIQKLPPGDYKKYDVSTGSGNGGASRVGTVSIFQVEKKPKSTKK